MSRLDSMTTVVSSSISLYIKTCTNICYEFCCSTQVLSSCDLIFVLVNVIVSLLSFCLLYFLSVRYFNCSMKTSEKVLSFFMA